MDAIKTLIQTYPTIQIAMTILSLIGYLIIRRLMFKVVLERAVLHNFEETRSRYIKKSVSVGLGLVFLVIIGIIWEISLKGLSVYMASILTVVGVGLFANWSIVSNITASVILFFFFPFRIGSKVRIMDGDNSVEGIVVNVSLFSIKIKRDDGHDIYYPNNLAIQKSIVHLKD